MTQDFGAWARLYAQARPRYPEALFDRLAECCARHDVAWDCATGSGQAAVSLAGRFARVLATDHSAEQIREAAPHPRIEYRVARAEDSGLPAASVDLVTVAAAIHWFDLDAFARELVRVVRPGGVVAAWTYHAADFEGPVGARVEAFYRDVVRAHFPPGFELVEAHYEGLRLPGEPLELPPFTIEADWTRDELLAFVRSWSGTQRYQHAHGEDPTVELERDLRALLPDGARLRLRWPLYLRASRL